MKKTVVLGVSGGIAAFKAAQLTSNLIKKGYDVEVIMTQNATEFITPLTFESLTKHNVMVSTFEKVADRSVKHIAWSCGRYADDDLSCRRLSQGDLSGNEYRNV